MSHMCDVVHTKTNGQNYVDTRDDVDSDVPEVKKADDICQGDDDNGENHETDGKIGEEYQRDNEDTKHSKANISPHLKPDNLVCLPSSIHLNMAKGSGNV